MKDYIYYPEIDYDFEIDIGKDEIIEFLWEEETGKEFNPFLYSLEQNGKEIYNKLEYAWLHNTLDEYAIMHNPKFHTYCEEKFREDALAEYEEVKWYDDDADPDEWWEHLNDADKEDIMRKYLCE